MENKEQGKKDPREEAPPAPWEWAVAALGAVLVAGTLLFLVTAALRGGDMPPSPELRVVAIHQQDTRFLVQVQARNRGEAPAANLRIRGVLKDGEREVEEAETEFQYVPGGSSREAGLFFATDPRRLRLELSARSYQQP